MLPISLETLQTRSHGPQVILQLLSSHCTTQRPEKAHPDFPEGASHKLAHLQGCYFLGKSFTLYICKKYKIWSLEMSEGGTTRGL